MIVRIPCPEPFYITAKQGDAIYEIWQDFKNWTVRYGYMNDGSQFPEGEIARQTLEGLFPNRRVVMIHTTALNILGGGIHCITKNISL